MSRERGYAATGDTYSPTERDLLFTLEIVGTLGSDQIARALLRSKGSMVKREWNRICLDATDYPYKHHYDVHSLLDPKHPLPRLTPKAKEYIRIQYTDPNIQTSVSELAVRIGIQEQKVQEYVDSLSKEKDGSKSPIPKKKKIPIEQTITEEEYLICLRALEKIVGRRIKRTKGKEQCQKP